MAQELSRAKEKNMTLIEDNRSLASQLVFYQEDAKTTSENLVIKDAEVMLLVMVAGSFTLALTRFLRTTIMPFYTSLRVDCSHMTSRRSF